MGQEFFNIPPPSSAMDAVHPELLNLLRRRTDESGMEFSGDTEGAIRGVMGEAVFEQILASAQRGDSRAFEQLYESMNRRVHAFVSLRGAADPAGTVNDVFLKAFTNVNSFVGNEIQFSAWTFKIARNILIDEARRRARRPEQTVFDDDDESAGGTGDVEREAFDQLGNEWVLAQLQALTPEQRDVVVMRVVSDLTIEAIAEVLGKPVGAVKAMQRRAFRTLARNFDDLPVPR